MNAATKTAKFTIIRKTIDRVYVIYSEGWEGPSKVTTIGKITKFTKTAKFKITCQSNYNIYEICSKGCREGPSKDTKITKFAKTAKFTIIRRTCYNINEMYSKSCRADPLKDTRIAKMTKFTKTAKFLENSQDQSQRNLFKKLQGRPIESNKNCENYGIYENCEIYNNSPGHLQNQRNSFKGLEGL